MKTTNVKKPRQKKGNSTALVIKNDVPTVLSILKEKLETLKHVTESNYQGTTELTGFGDISKEDKIENLNRAWSTLKAKSYWYDLAAIDLKRKSIGVFEEGGNDMKAWFHNINLRIAIIEHQETLDTIKGFQKEFEGFMTKDEQKEMATQRVVEFLNKH